MAVRPKTRQDDLLWQKVVPSAPLPRDARDEQKRLQEAGLPPKPWFKQVLS